MANAEPRPFGGYSKNFKVQARTKIKNRHSNDGLQKYSTRLYHIKENKNMLNEFGVPTEPPEEKIVAHDWQGEPIFSGDPDVYFNTDDGYVLKDKYELEKYVKHLWGNPHHISEWEA